MYSCKNLGLFNTACDLQCHVCQVTVIFPAGGYNKCQLFLLVNHRDVEKAETSNRTVH